MNSLGENEGRMEIGGDLMHKLHGKTFKIPETFTETALRGKTLAFNVMAHPPYPKLFIYIPAKEFPAEPGKWLSTDVVLKLVQLVNETYGLNLSLNQKDILASHTFIGENFHYSISINI